MNSIIGRLLLQAFKVRGQQGIWRVELPNG